MRIQLKMRRWKSPYKITKIWCNISKWRKEKLVTQILEASLTLVRHRQDPYQGCPRLTHKPALKRLRAQRRKSQSHLQQIICIRISIARDSKAALTTIDKEVKIATNSWGLQNRPTTLSAVQVSRDQFQDLRSKLKILMMTIGRKWISHLFPSPKIQV